MGLSIDESSSVPAIDAKRMLYVDNIRIFLTVLVVLHHLAIGYGGVGDWVIFDKATDSVSPIFLTLFYLFQKKFDNQGRLLKGMSPNAYTVYIIHQLVVVILMALFLAIALPLIVKFFIVAPISITLCFLISHFIVRKIPYFKRVLG